MEQRERLLVVEDDPAMRQTIEKAAERLHLDPIRAADGWDAIRKLETNSYAAVVLDGKAAQNSAFGVIRYITEEFGQDTLSRVLFLGNESDERLQAPQLRVMARTDVVEDIVSAIERCESPIVK